MSGAYDITHLVNSVITDSSPLVTQKRFTEIQSLQLQVAHCAFLNIGSAAMARLTQASQSCGPNSYICAHCSPHCHRRLQMSTAHLALLQYVSYFHHVCFLFFYQPFFLEFYMRRPPVHSVNFARAINQSGPEKCLTPSPYEWPMRESP